MLSEYIYNRQVQNDKRAGHGLFFITKVYNFNTMPFSLGLNTI